MQPYYTLIRFAIYFAAKQRWSWGLGESCDFPQALLEADREMSVSFVSIKFREISH